MIKVYISGKITGEEPIVAENKFDYYEKLLRKIGFEPVNPFKVNVVSDADFLNKTWEDYMVADIKALFGCNAILMLNDWKDSKGARIEYNIAIEMNKMVIFENQIASLI